MQRRPLTCAACALAVLAVLAVPLFSMRLAFSDAGNDPASLTTRQDALPAEVGELDQPTPARVRQFESYLHTAGIGAVIVERAWAEPWMSIFGKLGMPATSVGGVTIYSTPRHFPS